VIARMVGTNRTRVVAAARHLLDDQAECDRIAAPNPYGDGRAVRRMVESILDIN
jgi:UDP-N-acetylglucosamine 2-epimerase